MYLGMERFRIGISHLNKDCAATNTVYLQKKAMATSRLLALLVYKIVEDEDTRT